MISADCMKTVVLLRGGLVVGGEVGVKITELNACAVESADSDNDSVPRPAVGNKLVTDGKTKLPVRAKGKSLELANVELRPTLYLGVESFDANDCNKLDFVTYNIEL